MQLAHSNFFIFRTPLLPIRKFLLTNQAQTEQTLTENLRILIIENPQILSGLMISSYQIGSITKSWIQNHTKLSQRQLLTIYKYIARMATRPTPFGLSAGIGLGYITQKQSLIKVLEYKKIHSRLPISYITSKLHSSRIDLNSFSGKLRLNSMMFEHAGFYRYAKKKENGSYFDRVKIKKNPLLEIVIQEINSGTTFFKLMETMTQTGLTKKEANLYLEKLIGNQFIVTPFEPALTGNHFKSMLVDFTVKNKLDPLASILQERLDFDHNKMVSYWHELSNKLNENLFPELEVNMQFQTMNANINESIVNTIAQELMELQKFIDPIELPELESFKNKFRIRYDMQEVPILEALDSDLSIGFGNTNDQYSSSNPLLQSLAFKKVPPHHTNNLLNFVDLQNIQTNKYVDLIIPNHLTEVHSLKEPDLPATSFAMGQLYSEGLNIINSENFKFVLKTWSGPSAVNLMTRFAHLDNELEKELIKLTNYEENTLKDFILAEVVYSPASKEATILQRPCLHQYELPVLGSSTTDEKYRLSLQDLTISIRNDKIYLRSKSLNKYIIPRISSAHNYKKANPVYRFLGDLQRQYSPLQFMWNWGDHDVKSFLPRVTYKHLILSRARWFISFEENREYNDKLIFQLESILHIDSIVLIAEADNELYLDLTTPWGRKILLNSMKKGPVTLYEFINTSDSVIKNMSGDGFINEFIVPLRFNGKPMYLPVESNQTCTLARSFPPGSQWTFIKIYCAASEANEIIVTKLVQVIMELKNINIIQKWFFVRYSDPDFHIRIRFYHPQNSSDGHAKIVLAFATVLRQLIEDKQVWKVQYDTYEREIERYGQDNMELVESLFCSSSETILAILKLHNYSDEHFIWQMAIKNVDSLFLAFELPVPERVALLEVWTKNFSAEFELSEKEQKQIRLNFRSIRNELITFLKTSEKNVDDIINKQIETTRKILNATSTETRAELKTKLDSIIHMHLNRNFPTEQRANEMVLYYYLLGIYRSELAREKFNYIALDQV